MEVVDHVWSAKPKQMQLTVDRSRIKRDCVIKVRFGFKMKKPYERLISVHLLEKKEEELNETNHYLWYWTYPSVNHSTRSFIEKRLEAHNSRIAQMENANSKQQHQFDCYRLDERWVFVLPYTIGSCQLAFVLLTTDFEPYTYQKVLTAFTELHQKRIHIGRFLHYYLTLLIEGQVVISELNNCLLDLTTTHSDYNEQAVDERNQHDIKWIINLFHLDTILIYTALLLKRKIVIYHHCQSVLFDFILALPGFVAHRAERYQLFFPNLDLGSPEQINQLQERSHYVATFWDPKVEEREELYDIYINLAAVEITIAHNAREIFSMTKTHKEVAIALVRVAENESSTNSDVIAEISKKTTELCYSLYQMGDYANDTNDTMVDNQVQVASTKKINKSHLKRKLLSPNLESFYWNLAMAEGIADNSS